MNENRPGEGLAPNPRPRLVCPAMHPRLRRAIRLSMLPLAMALVGCASSASPVSHSASGATARPGGYVQNTGRSKARPAASATAAPAADKKFRIATPSLWSVKNKTSMHPANPVSN